MYRESLVHKLYFVTVDLCRALGFFDRKVELGTLLVLKALFTIFKVYSI